LGTESSHKKSGLTTFSPLTRFVQKYLTVILLIICLIFLSVFWGFHLSLDSMSKDQLIGDGRSFFAEIVVTRLWMANHGGVYVKMVPGVEINPYLKQIPGLKVLIRDESDQLYVLKNPALVTREISELAAQRGIFNFRITSLNPLNKLNKPDAFEERSLQRFATGAREAYEFEEKKGVPFFRYMAPLITEASCLKCHASQGYKTGDVRGGISVTIPASTMIREMKTNRLYLLFLALGIVILTALVIYVIARFFIRELKQSENKLVEMATKDPLTGLLNRREAFRRIDTERSRSLRTSSPLSLIMCDIDHFKAINDTHGHLTGDFVLQSLAGVLSKTIRDYDILCRYGGEEFLIVMPGITSGPTMELAERIRATVEETDIKTEDGLSIRITISLGVAQLNGHEKIEAVISRADEALYEAKRKGRNQVHLA
jgi:diguanylate cyclase (GGDEF)-like protein